MRAAFNAELRKWKLDDLAKDAGMLKSEFSRVAYETFTNDLVDKNIFDAKGKRQYMQEFMKDATLRSPRLGGFWTTEEKVPTFQVREKIAEGSELVIPSNARLGIIQELTARGLPATGGRNAQSPQYQRSLGA